MNTANFRQKTGSRSDFASQRIAMPRSEHTRVLPVGTLVWSANEVRVLAKPCEVTVEARDATNYTNVRRLLLGGLHLGYCNATDPDEITFLREAAPTLPKAARAAIALREQLTAEHN